MKVKYQIHAFLWFSIAAQIQKISVFKYKYIFEPNRGTNKERPCYLSVKSVLYISSSDFRIFFDDNFDKSASFRISETGKYPNSRLTIVNIYTQFNVNKMVVSAVKLSGKQLSTWTSASIYRVTTMEMASIFTKKQKAFLRWNTCNFQRLNQTVFWRNLFLTNTCVRFYHQASYKDYERWCRGMAPNS